MSVRQITYRLFVLVLLIGLAQVLTAQVQARAQLDTNRIYIGDQLHLELAVRHSPGTNVFPPDLSKLDTIKNIELLEAGGWDTLQNTNQIVLRQRLLLTAFDSGSVYIPSIPITYQANGQNGQVFTNQLRLEVTNVPIDSAYLAPIKDIIGEPLRLEDALPYLLGLAVLALLGGLAYYWYRRRQLAEAPPVPEIIIPAHEIALKQLAKLQAAKLWQQGQVKEYLSQLTHIIREYLENRYKIRALELTTDEIVAQLKKSDISDEWTNRFQEMLQMADLVKFAKAVPPPDIHDKLMKEAETFVRETKEKPVLVEDSAATKSPIS